MPILNKRERLINFYESLLQNGATIELGVDKKPLHSASKRKLLNIEEIAQHLSNPKLENLKEKQFRIDLKETPLVVLDFDLYKCNEEIREALKLKLRLYFVKKGFCYVKSPRGGYHVYLRDNLNLDVMVDTLTICGIHHVDVLKITTGPNLVSRELVVFETKTSFKDTPLMLNTFNKNLKKEWLKNFPGMTQRTWISQGHRRKTLEYLIQKFKQLTEEELIEINNWFLPPKPFKELEFEILSKLDDLKLNNQNFDSKEVFNKISNLDIKIRNDHYYLFDTEQNEWFSISTFGLKEYLRSKLELPDYLFYQNWNKIFNFIKESKTVNGQKLTFNEKGIDFCPKTGFFYDPPAGLGIDLGKSIIDPVSFETEEDFFSFLSKTKAGLILQGFFKGDNEKLSLYVTKNILRLMFVAFLRNFDYFYRRPLMQKIIFLNGPGGTSKSTLFNFLALFCQEEKVIASNLNQLSSRFELSNFPEKNILCFPDAHISEKKFPGQMAVLKGLTGGDKQRLEVKFGDVSSKLLNLIVVITSNCSLNYFSEIVGDYSSFKRRVMNLPLYTTIEKKEGDFLEKNTQNFIDLIPFFIKNYNFFSESVQNLNNYDLELFILRNKIDSLYNLVDPFFAFLFLKTESSGDFETCLNSLYKKYIWFLLFEYDSSIYIPNVSKIKNILLSEDILAMEDFQEIFNLNILNSFFKNQLKGFQLLRLKERGFYEVLQSRVIFLPERVYKLKLIGKEVNYSRLTYLKGLKLIN